MKKFNELVKYWTAIAGTKEMAQWCVSMGLDLYLQNKVVHKLMAIQDEEARRKG
jgi:hypothetical protein